MPVRHPHPKQEKVQRSAARSDAQENHEALLAAAGRLLAQSPTASLAEVAAAAGVSRSTLYRHFGGREELIAAVGERPRRETIQGSEEQNDDAAYDDDGPRHRRVLL